MLFRSKVSGNFLKIKLILNKTLPVALLPAVLQVVLLPVVLPVVVCLCLPVVEGCPVVLLPVVLEVKQLQKS